MADKLAEGAERLAGNIERMFWCEAIGTYARALLAVPLPWTRMRQVYALLGLVKRYGAARVEAECERAIAAELFDVSRLKRMIVIASPPAAATVSSQRVLPPPRHLRPAKHYALVPLSSVSANEEGGAR